MGQSAEEVTITPELFRRTPQVTDVEAELVAMRRLADAMADDHAKTFDVCTEVARELCGADTCGISLRERTETGEDVFRWIALSGQLKEFVGGTMPRHFSPCGVCVDANQPILMKRPETYYKDLDVGTPFEDVLLVPLADKRSNLEGTIWIVSHGPDRKFDAEDRRVIQRLAVFTGAVLSLSKNARDAQGKAEDQALRFQELDHRIKNALMSMSGLVRYQLRDTTDPAIRASVEMAAGRVQAVGQIHHLAPNSETVDLGQFLKVLCTQLMDADPRFALKVLAEEILVPTSIATTVALIMCELMANAIKHAFAETNSGTITIDLKRAEKDILEMSVTDDGKRMKSTERPSGSGIGLDLVSRFAKQLGGKFVVQAEPKRFVVSFPVPVLSQKLRIATH